MTGMRAQAFALDPKRTPVLRPLAFLEAQAQRNDEAAIHFARALETYPEESPLWAGYGEVLQRHVDVRVVHGTAGGGRCGQGDEPGLFGRQQRGDVRLRLTLGLLP